MFCNLLPSKTTTRISESPTIFTDGGTSYGFSSYLCRRYDKRKNHPDRQRGCVQQTVRMGDAAPAGDGGALGPAASLVLSLRRSPIRETVTPFILRAGRPRQYTAFLGTNQGRPAFFLSLSDCKGWDGDRHKNNKHYLFTNYISRQ